MLSFTNQTTKSLNPKPSTSAEKAHSSALQKRLSALEARAKAERAHLRWRLTTSQAMHMATAARLRHATSLSIISAAFTEWRHKTGRSPGFLVRRARRDNLRRVWFRSWRATRPWRKVRGLSGLNADDLRRVGIPHIERGILRVFSSGVLHSHVGRGIAPKNP